LIFNLDLLKNDIIQLFNVVDVVGNLNILGGEPLLYSFLKEYLYFICENYVKINKILRIEISTNGTIIPDKELLEIFSSYNFHIYVADYSDEINMVDYTTKFNTVINLLNKYKIATTIRKTNWHKIECNNGELLKLNILKLKQHYISCNTETKLKTLFDGTIYQCLLSLLSEIIDNNIVAEDDKLHLYNFKNTKKTKLEFLNKFYRLETIGNGYLDYCKYCYGGDSKYFIDVERAKQISIYDIVN
jgi:molybdenum cofactor biosynthesis enzyme MoaA